MGRDHHRVRYLCGGALVLSTLMACLLGCGTSSTLVRDGGLPSSPRSRVGRYAAATLGGASYLDPSDLGPHHYGHSRGEKTGIVYTCRGGHIDIAHVRKSADWAAYLSMRVREVIEAGQSEFSYEPPEPSRHYVTLRYPPGWDGLSSEDRGRIAEDVSVALGQYLAFNGCVWHEILTWFGYSSVRFYPDFPSAFSWEDTYSDLLGTQVGITALRDTARPYDEAVALALEEELKTLGVRSKSTAIRASKQARGRWYTGDFLFLVNMKKRNFDVGLDDGYVTPWLVPGLAGCEGAEPERRPAPNLDVLGEQGFAVTFEIEPRSMESRAILAAAYPEPGSRKKRIEPMVHFRRIMEHIRQEGIRRFGTEVDVP